jgi:hypothetical protein
MVDQDYRTSSRSIVIKESFNTYVNHHRSSFNLFSD